MSEWKNLRNSIPTDWYTNKNYEIQVKRDGQGWQHSQYQVLRDRGTIIECNVEGDDYRYKERPCATLEEILTKWWKVGEFWTKIVGYGNDRYFPLNFAHPLASTDIGMVQIDWFKDRERSTNPWDIK